MLAFGFECLGITFGIVRESARKRKYFPYNRNAKRGEYFEKELFNARGRNDDDPGKKTNVNMIKYVLNRHSFSGCFQI